jgi:hypothetical protein
MDPNSEIGFMIALGICVLFSGAAIVLCLKNNDLARKVYAAHMYMRHLLVDEDIDRLCEEDRIRRESLEKEQVDCKRRLDGIESKLRLSVDSVGFVRYNSYENMSADLSYSAAFVNQEGDGILFSSIYTIEECRTYARKIEKGQCKSKISEDEQKAIEEACQGLKI